jgi:hypothetical protein
MLGASNITAAQLEAFEEPERGWLFSEVGK